MKAQSTLYKYTRNVQCQWQIPPLNATALEPTAQYMWPHNPAISAGADNSPSFFSPWNKQDIQLIVPLVFGNAWFNTQISEIFKTKMLLAYQARYQVTNMSNTKTRYEKLVFVCKRDVTNYTGGSSITSLTNPMNLAGAWNYALSDQAVGDAKDALNNGLHTERHQLTQSASWNYFFKLKSKEKFTLGPGQTKTSYIKQKAKEWKPISQYPDLIVNQVAQPNGSCNFIKGYPIVLYRMFSEPADINDAVAPATALSTRTQPVSLMSYQINYFIRKPTTSPGVVFQVLGADGIQNVVAASVVVMQNQNIIEQPQRNVD